MRTVLALLLMCAGSVAHAVEPFFAPAVPAGEIEVTLHATEGVTANQPVIASFGVPFPRGSITRTGATGALDRLRVFDGQTEVAAYVAELTPWRHRTNAQIDNQSVRVALVQVEVVFANPAVAKSLAVRWGGAPRTLSRPTRAVRAATSRQVTSGTFVAADMVFEPRVIPQLPADWLSRGVLKTTRVLPSDPSNGPGRDSPTAMHAVATWPGTQEAERAHKNNFYSTINEDTPGNVACQYKTEREPWLYDRAATTFALYLRSGSPKALREALRSADFYRGRISDRGEFSLAAGDAKYAYNEPLAYAYWLTGDETYLDAITRVATRQEAVEHVWSARFWTERSIAFKLMGYAIDYEITGSATRRDGINAVVQALAAHQDGAMLPIPTAGRLDGGWYHTGQQHDAGEMPAARYGASSWMTALISDALRRAYITGEDAATANMIRRTGTFFKGTLRQQVSQYGGQTWAPRYIIQWDGNDFAEADRVAPPLHEDEHALEVSAALAWADYFGALTGQRDPTLAAVVDNVYDTYDRGVNFWIRPGAPPEFRLSHCRKWGWEHRTSDGLSWAMAAAVAAPAETPLFANGFE